MFLSTNKCEGIGECIKICPTEAIRLINGKAFSCITCGACFEACPNQAIFKNKYDGYIVDRAKCNGCGVCEFSCPVDSIHIEEGLVKGICARCGVCVDACPTHSRVDGFDLIDDKQINFLKSMNLAIPTFNAYPKSKIIVKRNCVTTKHEDCILCGRCDYYCPTNAINVNIDQKGICSECRVCSDLCPTNAIDNFTVDHEKCVLCLNCLKNCPNESIILEDFKVDIIKSDEDITGSIISCLNCGLCADNSQTKALKQIDGKMRYDPSLDFFTALGKLKNHGIDDNIESKDSDSVLYSDGLSKKALDDLDNNQNLDKNSNQDLINDLNIIEKESKSLNVKSINNCPVSTLKENVKNGFGLSGFCVSCGKCVQVCDIQKAREFTTVEWDGSISEDCISCGICAELCPKDAILLKKGTIEVNTDECILCETCGIHCPVDAIPVTTMAKKQIISGFNLIDSKLCMNCKLCYRICPEDAIIDKDEEGMAVDKNKCIYCGACVNACPTKAFIFERDFETLNQSK